MGREHWEWLGGYGGGSRMTDEAKPVHTPTPEETHSWDKSEASILTESLRAKGFSVRLEAPGRKYFSSPYGYGVTIMLTPAQAKELAGDKQFIDLTQDGYRFRW